MLTDAKLRALKPRETLYRVADHAGLCIEVTPAGRKLWRLRYRHAGKASMVSLGAYPDVSLAQARELREEERRRLRAGENPAEARKIRHEAEGPTFREIADEWLSKQRQRLAPATYSKAEWLLSFAYSHVGARPVRDIRPPDVLAVLREIEADGHHETAHRVKSRMGQVFRYAVAVGKANADPTSALRGALAPVVPTRRSAVTEPAGIRALLIAMDGYTGLFPTRCALRLAPLVFVRPGELRAAEWAEFDLDGDDPQWLIPANRTKMRTAHVVPLAPQAVAILRELQPFTGNGRLLFPSTWSRDKPMSENTLNTALRRLGFDSSTHCAHGFRALASTRLNEMGFPPDVIERQLAHAPRNKVRAAYNRAEYLPQRREMMAAWADYLDSLRTAAAGKR